jgi:ectoine hydroxylase-related dioxygenase (phytanoyl-CoA dioxygenase family)
MITAETVKRAAAAYAREFAELGYFIAEDVLSQGDVDQLRSAVANIRTGAEVRRRRAVYGIRNLLEICPEVQHLARDTRIRNFVAPILGDGTFAVRAIFFDKVPGANWSLFWHQDNVIAVNRRLDLPGFIGWSNKAGVWQVQPPAEILSRMVAVRVHLDDCGSANGPLRVLPGSHRHGWLDNELAQWKARVPEVVCLAKAGGVVVICPLTLHASAAAEAPEHRRIIHLEFANEELPEGLDWNSRVGM